MGYIATVSVDGEKFSSGAQGTKRAAESQAAGLALQRFGERVKVEGGGEQGGSNGHSFQGEWIDPQSAISGETTARLHNLMEPIIFLACWTLLPAYLRDHIETCCPLWSQCCSLQCKWV